MGRLLQAAARLVPAVRARLQAAWRTAGRDALVVAVVLLTACVAVVVASFALVQVLGAVDSPFGIVLGFVVMFGLALSVPFVALKLGGGLYERLGG